MKLVNLKNLQKYYNHRFLYIYFSIINLYNIVDTGRPKKKKFSIVPAIIRSATELVKYYAAISEYVTETNIVFEGKLNIYIVYLYIHYQ